MCENDESKSDNKTTNGATASSDNTDKTTLTPDNNAEKEPREITTREAYFASLNEWVKRANISQNAMFMFPWYLMNTYPQFFLPQHANAGFMPDMGVQMPPNVQAAAAAQPQNPLNANNINAVLAGVPGFNGFGLRIINDQAQADIINRTGGYEYVVAPFWKRAVAEIIDMIIMIIFKVVTIFVVTNVIGYNIMLDLDRDVLNKAMDSEDFAGVILNLLDILTFSSDYLAFEIATKFSVCIYEAILTTFFEGATVGKLAMGLSIKYCEAMVLLPPNIAGMAQPPLGPQIQFGFQTPRIQMRALIFPAETPNFQRAFLRAVAKNVILSLLFPIFFLMVFFKNNRTAYDIMTKTIVVETSSQPPMLRRNQGQQQQ